MAQFKSCFFYGICRQILCCVNWFAVYTGGDLQRISTAEKILRIINFFMVEIMLKMWQGAFKIEFWPIFCQYFFWFSIKFVNMWKLCTKSLNLFRIYYNCKETQKYSNI